MPPPHKKFLFLLLISFIFFTFHFTVYTGNLEAGVCQTLYCHGNLNIPAYSNYVNPVSTNPATGKCGTCHRSGKFYDSAARNTTNSTIPNLSTAPAGGSHYQHASTTTYNYSCKLCHNATLFNSWIGNYTVPLSTSVHVNRATDIQFSTYVLTRPRITVGISSPTYFGFDAWNLIYSTRPPSDETYGYCKNLYCHGNFAGSGYETSVATWSAPSTADCGTCHAVAKYAANKTIVSQSTAPRGGSHWQHVSTTTYNYDCRLCHAETVNWAGTISSFPTHVDYATEIRFSTHTLSRERFALGISSPSYGDRNAWSVPYSTSPPDTTYEKCANLYCHGAINDLYVAKRATPTWGDSTTGACGTCHDAGRYDASAASAPAGWKHYQHSSSEAVSGVGVYKFRCRHCHENTVTWAGTIAFATWTHVQGLVDIKFSTDIRDAGGRYSTGTTWVEYYVGLPTSAAAGSYLNRGCDKLYCHSAGTRLWISTTTAAVTQATNYRAVYSTNAVTCSSCHDFLVSGSTVGPTYTLNSSTGGKPNAHPSHTGYDCIDCHKWTANANYTIRFSTHHVDAVYTTTPSASYSFNYVFRSTPAASTCENISCHNNKYAVWSDTVTLNCGECHMPTTAKDWDEKDSFDWNDGFTAGISSIGWYNAGHGLLTTSKYDSAGPGAGFTGNNPCLYCHTTSTAHNTTENYFRLANYNQATVEGMNNNCLICHGGSQPGYRPDTGYELKKATAATTLAIDANHWGAKHTTDGSYTDGGRFCWDCHDPHGDFETYTSTWIAYLIQRRPVELIRGTADPGYGIPYQLTATTVAFRSTIIGLAGSWSGPDYSTGTFRGVCQVCHDSDILYHRKDLYTSAHNTQRCLDCHLHTNKFAGACNMCHGGNTSGDNLSASQPSNYWPDGSSRTLASNNPVDRAGAHEKHILALAGRLGYLTIDGTMSVTGLSTDNQRKYCSYCHGNEMPPTGTGTDNTKHFDSTASTPPATLPGIGLSSSTTSGFKTLKSTWVVVSSTWVFWGTADVDNATFTFTSDAAVRYCDNDDCHWNTRTPTTDFGWYGSNNVSTPTPASCATCHREVGVSLSSYPAIGAHDKHARVGGGENYGYSCDKCHSPVYDVGRPTAPFATHLDNKVQWSFAEIQADLTFKSTATPSYTTPSGWTGLSVTAFSTGTCVNVYCHGIQRTRQWNQKYSELFSTDISTKCADCHELPPTSKSDGTLIAFAHTVHSSSYGATTAYSTRLGISSVNTPTAYLYGCGICHYEANSATTTLSVSEHAQGRVWVSSQTADVYFAPFATAGVAGVYTASTTAGAVARDSRGFEYTRGRCESVYCHGVSFSTGTRVFTEGTVSVSTPNWNWDLATSTWGVYSTWNVWTSSACGQCHNLYRSESHIHKKHIGGVATSSDAELYRFDCAECHRLVDNDPTDYKATISSRTVHINRQLTPDGRPWYNVDFSTYTGGLGFGATYSP